VPPTPYHTSAPGIKFHRGHSAGPKQQRAHQRCSARGESSEAGPDAPENMYVYGVYAKSSVNWPMGILLQHNSQTARSHGPGDNHFWPASVRGQCDASLYIFGSMGWQAQAIWPYHPLLEALVLCPDRPVNRRGNHYQLAFRVDKQKQSYIHHVAAITLPMILHTY
jgi:hypothetical protein